uniref:transcription factor HES-4-like isoform X1 n=2 Tax=Myxine glutinosa TaxID=7769 RepID=UPI003590026C
MHLMMTPTVAHGDDCVTDGEENGKVKTSMELRKTSKPIMEKRRRARINDSLNQLKALMLDALNKDTSRHSKLEKADILEMTVKHLQNIQCTHINSTLSEPANLGHYRAGYSACAAEVGRFVASCEDVALPVRTRLLAHLNDCVSGLPAQRPLDNYPEVDNPPSRESPQAKLKATHLCGMFPTNSGMVACVFIPSNTGFQDQTNPVGSLSKPPSESPTSNAASPVSIDIMRDPMSLAEHWELPSKPVWRP